jgi:hypothetical protein
MADGFDPDAYLRENKRGSKPPFDPSKPFEELPDAPRVKSTPVDKQRSFDPDAYLARPSKPAFDPSNDQ